MDAALVGNWAWEGGRYWLHCWPCPSPGHCRNQVLFVPFKLLFVCTRNCTAHLCWSFWEHPWYKLLWKFCSKGECAAERSGWFEHWERSVFCLKWSMLCHGVFVSYSNTASSDIINWKSNFSFLIFYLKAWSIKCIFFLMDQDQRIGNEITLWFFYSCFLNWKKRKSERQACSSIGIRFLWVTVRCYSVQDHVFENMGSGNSPFKLCSIGLKKIFPLNTYSTQYVCTASRACCNFAVFSITFWDL